MPFEAVLLEKYTSWIELEKKIESIKDNTPKGNAFEQFVYFFLLYHKELYQMEDIYSDKVPGRNIPKKIRESLKLESTDYGVDGVYVRTDGKTVAYQAKFRSNRGIPTSDELATFWAEAEYADYRCVIANSFSLPKTTQKKIDSIRILADKFLSLEPAFFEQLQKFTNAGSFKKRIPYVPYDFQKPIIAKLCSGLLKHNKGKLVAACGIGKTLVSLWTAEEHKSDCILFVAPSLILVRQTLASWTANAATHFSYICVCSDRTIGNELNNDDSFSLQPNELDIPVSTNVSEIVGFLKSDKQRKVIFSTYQSLDVISDALTKCSGVNFDLTIFDEAHRTAGVKTSELFGLGLNETQIRSDKRLFMTATERLVKPWIREKAWSNGATILSMDDIGTYGPLFYRLSFSEAIKNNVISDYKIVIGSVSNEQIAKLISVNRYILLEDPATGTSYKEPVTALDLFKACLLLRCISELGVKKIITYHSRVRDAKLFAKLITNIKEQTQACSGNFFATDINGTQTSAERSEYFEQFKRADIGILTNVRCLTEGVDLPYTDAVFFAEPKNSLIDIVQAIGRTLRKPYGTTSKLAHIILPIRLNPSDEIIYDDENFQNLHNVIQALRDQDERLADWVNQLNILHVTGKAMKSKASAQLRIILPERVDITQFEKYVMARISQVNANPTKLKAPSPLGKRERISNFQGVFRPMGDYNADIYMESLVLPTLRKFPNTEAILSRKDLKFNNNNVSHCERIRAIFQESKDAFSLTKLGKLLVNGTIDIYNYFKNQMMLFYIDDVSGQMFPYRYAFEVLKNVNKVNYIEFLYGIYSLEPETSDNLSIESAISRVRQIRTLFPNIMATSEANKNQVLEALANLYPSIEFSFKDVWTDRTTAGNRFRFFSNHMALYSDLFTWNESIKELSLLNGKEEDVDVILEKSVPPYKAFEDFNGFWRWI